MTIYQRPRFAGDRLAEEAFTSGQDAEQRMQSALARQAFTGQAALENYERELKTDAKIAKKYKQPVRARDWSGIVNAGADVVSSLLAPRSNAAPSSQFTAPADFWGAARPVNSDTSLNNAFTGPPLINLKPSGWSPPANVF